MQPNQNQLRTKQFTKILILAVGLYALSSIWMTTATRYHSDFFIHGRGLPIYAAAFFLPFYPAVIFSILISLFAVYLGFPPVESIRICLFTILLAVIARHKRALSPVMFLSMLWALWECSLLLGSNVFQISGLPTWSFERFTALTIEITGVLLISLLRIAPALRQSMTAKLPAVESLTLYTDLAALATFSCSALALYSIVKTSGQSPEEIILRLGSDKQAALLLMGSLVLLPTVLGAIGSLAIRRFAGSLENLAQSDPRIGLHHAATVIREFRDSYALVRESLAKLHSDLRYAQRTIKELDHAKDAQENEVRRRESTSRNLMRILDHSAVGAISLTAQGTIITINSKMQSLLGLEGHSPIGQQFSSIQFNTPWGKEISELLVNACRDPHQLLGSEPIRHYCTPRENLILKLELSAQSSAEFKNHQSYQIPTSELAVVLLAYEQADLRQFYLHLLAGEEAKAEQKAVKFDIGFFLNAGVKFLYESLALDEIAPFACEGKQPLVEIPPHKFYQLLAKTLHTVEQMLPHTSELKFEIATEAIDERTASLLPGSHAGIFARFCISHEGVSVTSQMLSSRTHAAQSELELACQKLTTLVRQIGGFVSIQSSQLRGTALTVYVPQMHDAVLRPAEKKPAKASDSTAPTSQTDPTEENTGPSVLLVTGSSSIDQQIVELMNALTGDLSIKSLHQIEAELNTELFGSGAGFAEATGEHQAGSSVTVHVDALVVTVEKTTTEILDLVKTLKSEHQATTTLLILATDEDGEEAINQGFTILHQPVELEVLKRALKI
ncbi:hypothetical protein JNK13_06015 [bacterium]|nr:hypothetical protein [bacterium]